MFISSLRNDLKNEAFLENITKKNESHLGRMIDEISILEKSLAVSFSDALLLVKETISNLE